MFDNMSYIKQDIEREVNYSISDYRYGAISADKLYKLIDELNDIKATIDACISKIMSVLGEAPVTLHNYGSVLYPEEFPSPSPSAVVTTTSHGHVHVSADMNKLKDIIIHISRKHGMPPNEILETVRMMLENE